MGNGLNYMSRTRHSDSLVNNPASYWWA